MSTNPNDIVRVRARANGRASVYEANAWCQSLSQGVLDGNGVIQNTSADMNVLVGGTSNKPDVVIASNPSGYKVALDIVGQKAVAITAPVSNKRITSIVAYTDDLSLASTDTSITGSPSSCGLVVVNGTASASPSAPDDATIRTAITADGATGSQACYCVLAEILVDHTTTTITNSLIDNKISGVNQIADLAVKANSIDWTTISDISFQTGTGDRKTVPANSSVSPLSYTVPSDGLYLIYAETKVEFYANSISLFISVNNVNKANTSHDMISQADFYMSFGTFLPYRLNTGDIVSMSLTAGNKNMGYFGSATKLVCVKIGG